MKIAVFAAVVLISGCEVAPAVPDDAPTTAPIESLGDRTWRLLESGLRGLHGQNIRAAITLFGYPTNNRIIVGDWVYNWDFVDSVPMAFGYQPLPIYCHIEIAATPDGTIKTSRYDGNVGGCGRYANAFARQ